MITLGTDTDGHEQIAQRKRYRRGYFGSVVAAAIGLWVALLAGYPIVGVLFYWTGIGTMFVLLFRAPVQLFDERDQRLEQRAASLTLNTVAIAGIVAIPGAVALQEAGVIEIPKWTMGAILGFVGLFVVFGIYMIYLSRRQ
jgi:tellurite resistance protein TehA-like permease